MTAKPTSGSKATAPWAIDWLWRGQFALLVGFAIASIAPVRAQISQVNPGVIQNDIERQQRQFEQQAAPPKLQGPGVVGGQRETSPLLRPGGPKFLLRKVRFEPSHFLTPQELDGIAKKYVGRKIDISDLLQLVADINAIYTQRGIVTGIATLPPQSADGGVVQIKLTEGRLNTSSIEGNKQTSDFYIRQRVNPREGEVLDVPRLNRDVTWFNRTNDVQIKALLQPGTDFGLTDLKLAVIEPPVDTLQLFVDNQGAQNTGAFQQGVYYKRHGLFGVDDRLTFYGVRADGNLNGNVAYNIPINPWGGRIGVSYTQGKIKVIDGPFVSLDVTGTSTQSAINLSQPVLATDNWLLLLNGATTVGSTTSDFTGVAVTNDHYGKWTSGFALTHFGNGYSVTISPAVNVVHWHDSILGGAENFNTFTGSATASAKLPVDFSVSFLASWQFSPTHLLPGDQVFSVGGPSTVRGYPSNAETGDSGYYGNLELHRDWSALLKGFDAYLFTDFGAAFSPSIGRVDLVSVGAGASWTPRPAWTLEGNVATPLRTVIATQPRYQAYGRLIWRPLLSFM